ncbi:hypothetical protein [Commensalibacter oyaizuii]|uniref:Uncharacterized protein n=1 Tax=Commensalibacter oyaizuii TaxID=3043873 RepID=A0ABT6Q2W9_9PROT|nr:hypothetical protein [Commensalibacter sp. TBRC 16381]MDI2091474.1 hypothetical protein [Commensalibacter sp. TBRC 16381]
MINLFITLFISLTVPNHQPKDSQTLYREIINRIADEMFPIFCRQTLPQAISAIQYCYDTAGNDRIKNLACLIANKYTIDLIDSRYRGRIYDNGMELNSQFMTNYIQNYHNRAQLQYLQRYQNIFSSVNEYEDIIESYTWTLAKRFNTLYELKNIKILLRDYPCYDKDFLMNNFFISFIHRTSD